MKNAIFVLFGYVCGLLMAPALSHPPEECFTVNDYLQPRTLRDYESEADPLDSYNLYGLPSEKQRPILSDTLFLEDDSLGFSGFGVSSPQGFGEGNSGNRSGLGDSTNPGKGHGKSNSPNTGTANPNKAR